MDERDVRFLLHDTGQSALDWLAGQDLDERHTLSLIGALRRTLTPAQASAVLTTARLRQRAEAKFSRAAGMYFTPDALEQASGEAISRWRARRFADLGAARIADLGCGIGGDLLALAAVPGASAIGLDLDPVRLRLAGANLSAYGLSGALVQGDLLDPLPLTGVPAAFFDPARREAGRRIFSVRDMHPPLDVIRAWPFEALAVKLSPGVDLGELWPYTAAGAGVEFVSMGGELKEAVLWRGAWGFAGNRASRVEPDGSGETLEPRGLPAPPLAEPGAVLYEPDPAIIRAGLLTELGERLSVPVFRLDESIAYLVADTWIVSPWARAWPVWEWMPFNLKRLRAALRARGIGRVTVKKRGSPLAPEDLIRQLKLGGEGESAVVVLTRVAGQHTALICGERL